MAGEIAAQQRHDLPNESLIWARQSGRKKRGKLTKFSRAVSLRSGSTVFYSKALLCKLL